MWELEEQKILFGLFDKESISIRLTDSCTMLPRMSRSGIFGLKKIVYTTNNSIIKTNLSNYTPTQTTSGRAFINRDYNHID